MLMRNRELARFAALYVLLASAAVLGASFCFGRPAAWCLAAYASVQGVVLIVFLRRRYRDIERLSARIDAVLHGDRDLSLGSMREGDLSVLSSELEKMVARLHLTADELEKETHALADSLADISHQLKTPLTSLSIISELMRKRLIESREGLDASDVRELIDRLRVMQRLQERVRWLVAALLKMARVDAGMVELARVEVDASEVVRRAAETLAIPFDLADVALEVDAQPGAFFMGDPAWSTEALSNILKICMEHTDPGGTVSVRVRQDALACRIRVEDTGPGIAEADLPHVFERFYRGGEADGAAGSADVDPNGVGIGLSLAQSLVSAQGGAIRASNAVDEHGAVLGARFDIVFFSLNV